MDDNTSLYFVPPWFSHATESGRALLYLNGPGVVEADVSVPRLLKMCGGAKTLADHASVIACVSGQPPAVVHEGLVALVQAGMLNKLADGSPSQIKSSSATLQSIGIITADRPAMLARSVAECSSHLCQSQRSATVWVLDGSRAPSHQSLGESICREQRPRVQFVHVGAREAKAAASRLAGLGFSRDRLAWALQSGTSGANRNLCVLLNAGRPLLMMDDDVRWHVWGQPTSVEGLALGGHADSRLSRFFATRSDAIASTMEFQGNILAAHEQLLGRKLWDLREQALDLSTACPHLLAALSRNDPATVRVTMAGIAGDSAVHCPYLLLFSGEAGQADILRDPAAFDLALKSREVTRAVQRLTVTHDRRCMAYSLGLDNSSVLPPFLPRGRNEDGAFGSLLAATDGLALFGQLPVGVVHDSERPSARAAGPIASATQTRLSEAVMALADMAMSGALAREPAARLRYLGAQLSEVGRFTLPDLRDVLVKVLLPGRVQQLNQLDRILSAEGTRPSHWRDAAARYRDQLLDSAARSDFFCPIEFSEAGSVENRLACTRAALYEFGQLCIEWPDIWEQSRRVDLANDALPAAGHSAGAGYAHTA